MNVWDQIAWFIKTKKNTHIFGISWVPNLFLLNAIEKLGIQFIQNIHENNSLYWATGGYFATGNINFVVLTAGPGVTNALTAIANMYIDKIPCVIISINNSRNEYGLWTHHDSSSSTGVDLVSLVKHSSCYSESVMSPNTVMGVLAKAYSASEKYQQPSHISIAMDVLESSNISENIIYDYNQLWLKKTENSFDTKTFQELSLNWKRPIFIFSDFKSENHKMLEWLAKNNFYMCFLSRQKNVFYSPFFLWYIDYIKQTKVHKTLWLFEEIILIGNDFHKFSFENISSLIKDKKIIHFWTHSDAHIFGLYNSYYYYQINCFTDIFIQTLPQYYEPFLAAVITKIDQADQAKYKENKYYHIYGQLNTLLNTWESIFVSVGNTTEFWYKFLRPSLPGVEVYYTGRFFALWNSLPAIGYAYASQKKTYVMLGEWDFTMNWNELIGAKKYPMQLVLILCNNWGYKSLESAFFERYGYKYSQAQTFSSIDINVEKICEGFGIDYSFCSDISLLESLCNKDSSAIHLIEINT